MVEQQSGFIALLENGAVALKNNGSYQVELTPAQVEEMMRQVVVAFTERNTLRVALIGSSQ